MNARQRTALLLAFSTAAAGAACGNSPGTIGDDDDDTGNPDGANPDGARPDGRNPDGDVPDIDAPNADAVVPTVSPDVDGQLVINEIMASNALSLRDETNAAGDWFEIYNPTLTDLSLEGYAVTNDLGMPLKFHLHNVIIRAEDHVVLWADDRAEVGQYHVGFELDADGGQLGLARPDGTFIDRVHYGKQETDFAAARSPDGSDAWRIVWNLTPAAPNAPGPGAPMGLEIPANPPEEVPAAGDLTEHILGYAEMPRLEIQVTAANAAALEADPFTSVPGTLVFEGRSYGPVGIRCKGQNSFLPFSRKPSLRITIDEYDEDARFWGLKDMTLNNMSGDLSMMHERLAYWVMRQAGVPSSRANHLLLTVNGQSYGLYNNLETVKKKLVKRWFTDDTGSLFEATDVDFAAQYIPQYELESGADDRTALNGLAMALTMPSADAAITAAGGFADMDRFLRYWAAASVIAQFDAFPYSMPGDDYYVYVDPGTHRLAFLPWGMDETFYSGSVDVTNVYSVLARRCKESAACWQSYQAQVWQVQAITESMDLAGERDRVIAQIAPHVAADTRKPYTQEQVTESQGALYWFIHERRMKLNAMFAPPPPPPGNP